VLGPGGEKGAGEGSGRGGCYKAQGMSGRDVMGRGCIVIIRGPFALGLQECNMGWVGASSGGPGAHQSNKHHQGFHSVHRHHHALRFNSDWVL
jgi:hypothetical protein